MREETISFNGRRTHYWADGNPDAPMMLFLHGGFGDASLHWLDILPQMADTYYAIAPDLPGFGGSDRLSSLRLDALVAWVGDLLDALGVEQAAIVGNSFGGLIGRVFAARYPARVPALVLVNGGVLPAVPRTARLLARTPLLGPVLYRQLGRGQASWTGLNGAIQDDEVITPARYSTIKANARGLGHLMRTLSASPAPQDVTPRVPVLLLWGEEDALSPRISAERVQAEIPGAVLVLLAAARHMPYLEAEEAFVFQLRKFLAALNTHPGA